MSRLNLYTTKYIYRAEVVELEDEVHEYKPLGDIEVLEKFKCLSPRRSLANWAPREEIPAKTRENPLKNTHVCLMKVFWQTEMLR